ncbi:TolC family protein [Wenyingzhuangia sp. chi5]|uniref:TolC family protein n=1 Tax=Wenyingzhuangia gilva TaxID=3057677 RepID=A0ABT8VN97_9FLAO|nr:TolC family protein [Wenyingzhuangia sp. chi5]MDO3693417.1 TolC family protein [Wenyingzhuangia sp. chi5]
MKFKILLLSVFVTIGLQSQSKQSMNLKEAIHIALEQSDMSKIADVKVTTAENEMQVAKNLLYPDAKITGQYAYLTNANIDSKLNDNSSSSGSNSSPNINQLMFGQASVSMPLFTGFKLKNTVQASENNYKAATLNAETKKEEIALSVTQSFINLYKANQTILLIQESLKSAKQRVKDFTSMEQNGIIARNDLLKAQIQESNIEVGLEDAKKTANILNYRLAMMLKLPENTVIDIQSDDLGKLELVNDNISIERSDLEALDYQYKAAENQIKVAKGNYYPTIGLSGGYVALDLKNALSVTNAMNIGVGVSYDIGSIFKNKSNVKVAKSKAKELEYAIDVQNDAVKVEVENARQEYQLAVKKYTVFTRSEEQSIENYRIVQDKYNNGLADTNDLLEADVDQLQAKLNVTYAKANITEKYYAWLKATGLLINTLEK